MIIQDGNLKTKKTLTGATTLDLFLGVSEIPRDRGLLVGVAT